MHRLPFEAGAIIQWEGVIESTRVLFSRHLALLNHISLLSNCLPYFVSPRAAIHSTIYHRPLNQLSGTGHL